MGELGRGLWPNLGRIIPVVAVKAVAPDIRKGRASRRDHIGHHRE